MLLHIADFINPFQFFRLIRVEALRFHLLIRSYQSQKQKPLQPAGVTCLYNAVSHLKV